MTHISRSALAPLRSWYAHFFKLGNAHFIITFFVSLYLVSRYLKNISLQITNVAEVLPGIAAFNNVDINLRVSAFYNAVLLFLLCFALVSFLLYVLHNQIRQWKRLATGLGRIAWIGTLLVFFEFIQLVDKQSFDLLFTLTALFFVYELTYSYIGFGRLKNTQGVFMWLLTLSYGASFLLKEMVFMAELSWTFAFLSYFCFAFVAFLSSFVVLQRFTTIPFQSLLIGSFIFYIIPFLSILSDELYLILNQRDIHLLSPNHFYLFFLGLSLALLFIYFKKIRQLQLNRLLANFMYPAVLLSMILFTHYTPIMSQPQDMFELANPANGLMRLFMHSELPIADALSSHVLADFGFKPLYVWLNGWSGEVDFLLYDVWEKGIFILLFYFFLKGFTNRPDVVFALIVWFPYLHYIYLSYYCLVFVSLALLHSLFKHYTRRKLFILAFWTLCTIVWKIDVGISIAFATAIVYLFFLIEKHFDKHILKDTAWAVISVIITVVLSAVVLMSTGSDLVVNFKQALSYFGGNQAHGYTDISNQHDRLYQVHYFIFPIIASLLVLVLGTQLLKIRHQRAKWRILSIMALLAYYFMNAQRGLVRHSLVEGSEMFLNTWLYLAIGLTVYQLWHKKAYALTLMMLTIVGSIYSYTATSGNPNYYEQFIARFNQYTEVSKTNTKYARVENSEVFKRHTYLDFDNFMKTNFSNKATFIDFSNTPMLYFYTKRQVPSYFNQYMQNTVTSFLQIENIKKLNSMEVPVVVYSHLPENWWDNTDGVPNRIRYYHISQYIFKHYRPFAHINDYYIWLKQGVQAAIPQQAKINDSIVFENKNDNLKLYPYVLANNWTDSAAYQAVTSWQNLNQVFDNKPINKHKLYTWVKIRLAPHTQNENLVFAYYNKDKVMGTFTFEAPASDTDTQFLIPLSSQYNWVNSNITGWQLYTIFAQPKTAKEVVLLQGSDTDTTHENK